MRVQMASVMALYSWVLRSPREQTKTRHDLLLSRVHEEEGRAVVELSTGARGRPLPSPRRMSCVMPAAGPQTASVVVVAGSTRRREAFPS